MLMYMWKQCQASCGLPAFTLSTYPSPFTPKQTKCLLNLGSNWTTTSVEANTKAIPVHPSDSCGNAVRLKCYHPSAHEEIRLCALMWCTDSSLLPGRAQENMPPAVFPSDHQVPFPSSKGPKYFIVSKLWKERMGDFSHTNLYTLPT